MKVELLGQYFNGLIEAPRLAEEISSEVQEHVSKLRKRGASAPVYIIGEGPVRVTKKEVEKLCYDFSNKELLESHVNYIANAILLSEAFQIENEAVEQVLVELSDPALGGPMNEDLIAFVKEYLKNN